MANYNFPGVGTLSVNRHGEYGSPERFKYTVRAVSTDDTVYRSWITVPADVGENTVVAAALDAVDFEADSMETGTMWGVYASEIGDPDDDGETAAFYRTDGVSHYRFNPYTYDPDSDIFFTMREVVEYVKRNGEPGETYFLYSNDADEPRRVLNVGPRGGVKMESL